MHIVINNLYKLKYFIKRYKILAQEIIVEAKKPKNRIILPYFNEEKPVGHYNIIIAQEKKTNHEHALNLLRHKDTQKPVFLSSQQSKCFKLLLQGYSAKKLLKRWDYLIEQLKIIEKRLEKF